MHISRKKFILHSKVVGSSVESSVKVLHGYNILTMDGMKKYTELLKRMGKNCMEEKVKKKNAKCNESKQCSTFAFTNKWLYSLYCIYLSFLTKRRMKIEGDIEINGVSFSMRQNFIYIRNENKTQIYIAERYRGRKKNELLAFYSLTFYAHK